jgi:hypothetical protein
MKGSSTSDHGANHRTWTTVVSQVQGWYCILGSIWPLVSPTTFQAVTGTKMDFWLAQTVGLLLIVTGLVLIKAARRGRLTAEIALLGIGQAIVLGSVDVFCVREPRTTVAYYLDAIAEFTLVAAWLIALSHDRSHRDVTLTKWSG